MEERIELLKKMNEYICEVIGDEESWETWVALGVPDCPSEEDYTFIASSDRDWKEVVKLFSKLVQTEE